VAQARFLVMAADFRAAQRKDGAPASIDTYMQ